MTGNRGGWAFSLGLSVVQWLHVRCYRWRSRFILTRTATVCAPEVGWRAGGPGFRVVRLLSLSFTPNGGQFTTASLRPNERGRHHWGFGIWDHYEGSDMRERSEYG